MTSEMNESEFLASIQPVVLVGGQSVRFGRDKLREPWGVDGRVLVQRPIEALRAVFGARVKLVGACDESIVPLADGTIPDVHPGIGPMGGIASALEAWGGPVFVLAGDMPMVTAEVVRRVVAAGRPNAGALAVLAETDRLHPCAGVYAAAALPLLTARVGAGEYRLGSALPPGLVVGVRVDAEAMRNVNVTEDCEAADARGAGAR